MTARAWWRELRELIIGMDAVVSAAMMP